MSNNFIVMHFPDPKDRTPNQPLILVTIDEIRNYFWQVGDDSSYKDSSTMAKAYAALAIESYGWDYSSVSGATVMLSMTGVRLIRSDEFDPVESNGGHARNVK